MSQPLASSTYEGWHTVFADGVEWRLVESGVAIRDTGVERTSGPPNTVARIWRMYGDRIAAVSRRRLVPCEALVATICTESGGRADATRFEPGYVSDEQTPSRVSYGLMQTLLSTARSALEISLDREYLLDPLGSIEAGAAYIRRQRRITGYDPPLVAAAYNSGGVYEQRGSQNRWKMRQYPIGTGAHVDRFVLFYNDAVAFLRDNGASSLYSHSNLLSGQ